MTACLLYEVVFPLTLPLCLLLLSGDGHVEGALGGAGVLPLALFVCVVDALGALGVAGGLPLAPFVGAADALGPGDALGVEGGLSLDLFAGLGDTLGVVGDGLPLDLFAGPRDALGSACGLPLDLFVECSAYVCAFYMHIVKINVIITYQSNITYQINVKDCTFGLPKPEVLPFPLFCI